MTENASGDATLRYCRIVAKFGTNLLTAGTDRLDLGAMAALVGQVARLVHEGAQVVIVSSGAIAAGRHQLRAQLNEGAVPARQALAAVGQSHLMQSYDELFGWHDVVVAQTLLTRRDLSDRVGYLNARNTLLNLLSLGVVPVVNENDVVAVEEIEGAVIGDNDNLSALVTNLIDADLLAIAGDTTGLHTADPRVDPWAELVPTVERIDEDIERMAGGAGSSRGTGGMMTKLEAARLATAGGADVFLASGHEPDVLVRLAHGEHIGTHFLPTAERIESRKRWLISGLTARGQIVVDDGAAKALREGKKSLLPAGVVDVQGPFSRGETVYIVSRDGERIACGVTNYSDGEVAAIKGLRSDRIADVLGHEYGEEIVHRDDLAAF